jgi:hypothetical protein
MCPRNSLEADDREESLLRRLRKAGELLAQCVITALTTGCEYPVLVSSKQIKPGQHVTVLAHCSYPLL